MNLIYLVTSRSTELALTKVLHYESVTDKMNCFFSCATVAL